jgi:uncharacterized protein (TIGR03437 family)
MTTGWLSATPAAGTAPGDLMISATPTGIPAGTYLGQVVITGGSIAVVVNVFFTVESGAGGGTFVASPSNLTFIGQGGEPILPTQTIQVANPNSTGIAFDVSASSAGNWLSVLPNTGVTPASLTIAASQAGLAAGTYSGTITITPRGTGNPTLVPVTLTATGINVRTTKLVLSQPSLRLTHQIGTLEPALQSVEVSTPGENLEYTATTATTWLRLVDPLTTMPSTTVTGLTPDVFSVQVNPAGLAVGSHLGTINVNVPGLTSQVIGVTLTISSTPGLNANPSSLVFEYPIGSDTFPSRDVTIASTGSANLLFTTSVTAPWLRVTPTSGNTATGGATAITVSANPVGLTAGEYTGSVTLTVQGGSSVAIPVSLTVTGDQNVGEIEVSPAAVELTGLVGGPSSTQVVIVATGRIDEGNLGMPHNFTAAASSAEGWLVVSPISGTTPATLTISANPSRIREAGTYEGAVTVTSLLNGSQKVIMVTYQPSERAIAAAPTSLSFVQTQRGVNPSPQTVQITANSPSTFTVSETPPWLRVSPTTGAVPVTLTVWVDLSVMPPGTTQETIVVAGPNNQLSIPVSVTPLAPPAPTVSPGSIAMTHQIGNAAPPAQTINVGSTTGEPVTFSATVSTESGGNWLAVTPTSGTAPTSLRASVNVAQLVPGSYKGTIAIGSNGSGTPQSISVNLTVTAAALVVQRILHGATLAPTPVAPGQLVTITGTGLGPVLGVSGRPTAAGAYETQLANVRVLFDDLPAPLLYVANDQINAIVPYGLYGRLSARVQVESGTSLSVPIEVRVVDSAPGVFTAGGLGRGQAGALNADLTSNSASNPADRGSIITVYATGEGQTDPQGQDGRIILTDLRRPLLPVTARIGGRPAEVTYAGSASMMVSGMFQVNIRVPDGVDPGNVPVEIQVGTAVSQSGVTIVVR